MRSIARVIPIIALLAVNGPIAPAQPSGASAESRPCGLNSTTAAPYERCMLWTSGKELRRGKPGEELSHSRFVSPLALSPFVIGDSARRYALHYERNARRGLALKFVAVGLISAGLIAGIRTPCVKPRCVGSHPASINKTLIAGGLVVEVASLSFRYRARHAMAAALTWHNALLAR